MNVAGSRVIVTGAASGLGLGFARHLASLGARVWGLDRDEDALRAAESVPTGGLQFVRCDVGDDAAVAATVASVDAEGAGIDVLINNAAILRDQALASKLAGRIRRHSLEDWHETLRSNLTGPFLMAREVAATMIQRRIRGLVVNVSSISRHGNPGQSAYAASKAGIDALTSTWSQELAPYGIRVVALAPGFVETSMTRRIPPMFLERIRTRTPLQRFGTLDEFARTIQFVIENDYLNGKVLELDGGLRF